MTGVDGRVTIIVQNIGPIAHQPADVRISTVGIGCGNHMARGERRKLDAPAGEEPVGGDGPQTAMRH